MTAERDARTRWTSTAFGAAMLAIVVLGTTACGDNDNSSVERGRDDFEFRCPGTDEPTIVSSDEGAELAPPFSLHVATQGITVTIFPPVTASLDVVLQVHFAARGNLVPECVVVDTEERDLVPVHTGARDGIAVRYSRADLANVVTLLQSSNSSRCSFVGSTNDLTITRVVANPASVGASREIDGVAIGRSASTLPTPATELPTCLDVPADA